MATPIELEASIRGFDVTGLFLSPMGQLKLKGICNGVSAWLKSGSYSVGSFSVGSGGVGVCTGLLFLNVGGASGIMESGLRGVGQMSGLEVKPYASCLGQGIGSLAYRVSGGSPAVGVGTFTIISGFGEPSSLGYFLGVGLSSVGYGGVVSPLEIGGLAQGIVGLFTIGVSGSGGVVGTASPSALSAPNAPLFVF